MNESIPTERESGGTANEEKEGKSPLGDSFEVIFQDFPTLAPATAKKYK